MNKDSFLEETHNFIDECYSGFEKYQRITWDVLCHINMVFRENGIEYYLAYGTLLGAVRDGSNIPWDYDVDIHVKINQLDRLIDVLETKLGDDYYYVFTNNMRNYPADCLRICKKGYTYMSIHVDVFFLIGGESTTKERISTLRWVHRLAKIRAIKYSKEHLPRPTYSAIKRILLQILYTPISLIPLAYLRYKERKIYFKNDIDKADTYISFTVDANWGKNEFSVFPARIFKPLDFQIGNDTFIIPEGYEDYLTIEFGKWQSYLPIKNRFDDFYSQLFQIQERQKFYLEHLV